MPALLAVDHVSRWYGRLAAVDDVSLTVPAGARHALIGPNGAGKTTLLHLISGRLTPHRGTIRLDGRDVTRRGVVTRARAGLGRTHQQPAVFGSLRVRDNVVVAGWRAAAHPWISLATGRFGSDLVEPALDLLERFGLAADRDVAAGNLPHGKRRQLELAMAMAGRPRLLLLDEPAAGLPPRDVEHLAAVLRSLPDTVAVVLVEHDLDLVYSCAQTVTVLASGHEVITGTCDEIRSSHIVRDAYLTAG